MDASVLEVVLGTVWVLAFLAAVVYLHDLRIREKLYRSVEYYHYKNDEAQAVDTCLWLISQAESELLIYDDGHAKNRGLSSLYENEEVIAAIKEKVRANDQFKVRAFFNSGDDTAYSKAFETRASSGGSVAIRRPADGQRPADEHLKIVDGGKIVNISMHDFGAQDRDCGILTAEVSAESRRLLWPTILNIFWRRRKPLLAAVVVAPVIQDYLDRFAVLWGPEQQGGMEMEAAQNLPVAPR